MGRLLRNKLRKIFSSLAKAKTLAFSLLVLREGLEPSSLCRQQILSLPCIPIPPLQHNMRSEAELNRCRGFCRPLPNHSAIGPCRELYNIVK